VVGCIAYGALISAYLLGYTLLGDTFDPVGLTANLMPIPLLPALILFPLALLMRRGWALLFSLPGMVALIIGYGMLFLPVQFRPQYAASALSPSSGFAEESRRQGEATFTVLTFNAYADARIVDETFDVIRDANADIVLIQELNINLTDIITDQLSDAYPYRYLRPRTFSVTGMGILSKYPLEEGEYWREAAHWGRQTAWITIDNRRIAVFNVHAMAPFARGRGLYDLTRRERDLDVILDWFETSANTPYQIAAGDFNMTDHTAHYRRMAQRFIDAHRAAGFGFAPTFPNFNRALGDRSFPLTLVPPLIRIDYVFHSPTIAALDARTLYTSGESDHYPVLVTLAFAP
jgi:endonuclease/exonuclease/phosphatase (EEP) superfamily protein YafD